MNRRRVYRRQFIILHCSGTGKEPNVGISSHPLRDTGVRTDLCKISRTGLPFGWSSSVDSWRTSNTVQPNCYHSCASVKAGPRPQPHWPIRGCSSVSRQEPIRCLMSCSTIPRQKTDVSSKLDPWQTTKRSEALGTGQDLQELELDNPECGRVWRHPQRSTRFCLQPHGAARIRRALETPPAKKGCRVASLTLPDSRRWKCPK